MRIDVPRCRRGFSDRLNVAELYWRGGGASSSGLSPSSVVTVGFFTKSAYVAVGGVAVAVGDAGDGGGGAKD